MADAFDFVMTFVEASDTYKRQFTDKWEVVLANVMVDLDREFIGQKSPYSHGAIYKSGPRGRDRIRLKDPETHKLVWTYASKLVRSVFGDMYHEYCRARPTGFEDAKKSQTATRYLRYTFGLQGHFRTIVEAVVDMIIFGTAIIESPWKLEERWVLARSIETVMGPDGQPVTMDNMERVKMPVYDDVALRNVDIMDFYPDPARYRIHEMSGCAKRFRMNAAEARRCPFFDQDKVEEAIERGAGRTDGVAWDSIRRGVDQPSETEPISAYGEMMGYEYWGDVPEDIDLFEDGKKVESDRGVLAVLNGITVRQDAWPLADYCLPFHTFIINPMNGRFYGLSPAEVVRYDQSFADAIKILLAQAIIRQVHPPIAVDLDSEVDVGAVQAWEPDSIIAARGGPSSVGAVRYDAQVENGFALLQGLKLGIQEASGALGAIQGESGPDREAASVGTARLQFAMDRPELAAMVLENDCLPPLATAIIRRGQQFLDEEGLQQRVGELPEPVWLGDIMGDFDVQFFGSRQTMNRQQRLQSLDRLVALGQVFPAIQLVLPSQELAEQVVGDLMEMPDVAFQMKQLSEQQMMMNALAMKLQQGGGGMGGPARNGVPPAPEPAGLLPEQAAGGMGDMGGGV